MNPFRHPAARLVLVAGAAALFPVGAGAASAQNGAETHHRTSNVTDQVITCEGGRCEGTAEADTIIANNATQRVIGFGGDDDIELDAIFTSGSGDTAFGGEGRDCIDGGAGNDLMIGGPGDDNRPCEFTAFVDPQAALTGGPGEDTIVGGTGNDSMNRIFDDDRLLASRATTSSETPPRATRTVSTVVRATTPSTHGTATATTSSTAAPVTTTTPVTRTTGS